MEHGNTVNMINMVTTTINGDHGNRKQPSYETGIIIIINKE